MSEYAIVEIENGLTVTEIAPGATAEDACEALLAIPDEDEETEE